MAHVWAQGIVRRLSLSLPPALHYPAYRASGWGSWPRFAGFQILRFGQFWLIYQLTGSPLALGYMDSPTVFLLFVSISLAGFLPTDSTNAA